MLYTSRILDSVNGKTAIIDEKTSSNIADHYGLLNLYNYDLFKDEFMPNTAIQAMQDIKSSHTKRDFELYNKYQNIIDEFILFKNVAETLYRADVEDLPAQFDDIIYKNLDELMDGCGKQDLRVRILEKISSYNIGFYFKKN